MTISCGEDGGERKTTTEINKLSGWLNVSEINDNCRKLGVDGIVWKLKAVTFCAKTKQLFISSLNGDEQDIWPDSTLKSPSLDNNGSSPKSEKNSTSDLQFGGRSTRSRLDSQSSYGFKQFFSRKLAISRSRSVGKMGSQKSDASSPKSPVAFWASWRSQGDEPTCLDDEAAESSINLGDPNLSIIRPIHPSVLARQYCFQVITPLDMRYFCCRCEEEYYMWLRGLNSSVQYNRDEKIRLDTSLSIWIFEAKGIPVRKKYFCEILLDKILFSRTTAKCKHDMLFWGEQFSFEDLPPTESVTISLFRESDTKKKKKPDKNVFVGSSVIDLVNLETNTEIEKWVSIHIPGISPKLQQRTTVSNKTDQPSIRTKLKYETNVVLPLGNYDKLLEYLNENYLILTSTLEMLISLKTKDLLAQTLLKILMSSNKAESFLVDVIMNEVNNTTDENLTFRGNSLATKSIDTYMKMIGKNYIQETLVNFVNSVYELEGDTEVDPQKLNTHTNACLSDNQKCLIRLVEDAWRNIFLSIQIFPKNLQLVFSMVRKECEILDRDIAKKIVSASLFLRLLCPAILSPSLFLLTPEYPSEKVSRTLTLVAKTIQNLANFTRFGSKEGYMEILNDFVEREMSNMNNFLQRITYEPECIDDLETSCPSCMNIDLARELSVIYHLLSSELTKLPLDSAHAHKLDELRIILDEIQLVYATSPNADELRLCRPFASVALVCSKPLPTPTSGQRDDTPVSACGGITPSSTVDESEFDIETPTCYLDTSLSLIEDHVPGCSPVSNKRDSDEDTPSLMLHSNQNNIPSSVLLHSNQTDTASVLIHSNQNDILTKNTFVNATESTPVAFANSTDSTPVADDCKCDSFADIESIESSPGKGSYDSCPGKGIYDSCAPKLSDFILKDSDVQLTIYDIDGKTNHNNKPTKTPEHKPKNEKGLPGRKKPFEANARTKNLRETGTVKDRINMFSQRSESVPSKGSSDTSGKSSTQNKTSIHSYSQNINTNRTNNLQKIAEKNSTSPSKKSPPRISVSHAAAGTNDSKSSQRQQTNGEKMLSRQNSVDDDVTPDERCSESAENYVRVKDKRFPDRAKLKLHSLQKEHQFVDEVRDTYHCNHVTEQSKTIGYDKTKSNSKSRLKSSNGQRHAGKRQTSSSCEPRHVASDRLRAGKEYGVQRRYSEMTSQESEKQNFNRDTIVVAQSTEIAQIHSNGYCEILHEGIIERPNSVTSSCSSNCTYSSESYFSDEEYGTYISGDSLSEAMMQHNHMCETSMIPAGANQRQNASNNTHAHPNRTAQVNGHAHTNGYSCEDDIDAVRLKLRETELLLQKTQKELKSKTENFEHTVIHLKDKLIEGERRLIAEQAKKETEMKNAISRLLHVEDKLHNGHAEMEAVIKKQKGMIESLQKRNEVLKSSNLRLLRVLSNMKRNHTRQEDKDIDELLERLSNHSTPTDSQSTNGNPLTDAEDDDVEHV